MTKAPIYVTLPDDPHVWEFQPIDTIPAARSLLNRELCLRQQIRAIECQIEEMRASARPIDEAAKAYFEGKA